MSVGLGVTQWTVASRLFPVKLPSRATDVDTFADTVISAVAAAVAATGTASDPTAYAQAVADRLLPNVLPYTVGTSAVFGFASWNGRSLIDNAPDVMCSLATNTPVSLGIGKRTGIPPTVDGISLRPTAATAGMMADQSCAEHGGGHTTWTCRTCDQTVYGPPLQRALFGAGRFSGGADLD